jgi:hypothetical protein
MIAMFAQVQTAVGLVGNLDAPITDKQLQFKSIKANLLDDVRSLIAKLKAGAGSNYEKLGISKYGNVRCRDLQNMFFEIEKKLTHDLKTDNPLEHKYTTVLSASQDFLYALNHLDKTLSVRDKYEVRKINKDYIEHFVMGLVS